MDLTLPVQTNAGDFAVGDWVLVDPHSHLLHRRLIRKTVLERRTQGTKVRQLAAANVADFNPARLERYLALANEAGTTPVILLTKADTVADAREYKEQSAALGPGTLLRHGYTVVCLPAQFLNAEFFPHPLETVGCHGVGGVQLVCGLVFEIFEPFGDLLSASG